MPYEHARGELVRDHLETFLAQARHQRDGGGVPRFVDQEFRDFLRCGCCVDAGGRFIPCPTLMPWMWPRCWGLSWRRIRRRGDATEEAEAAGPGPCPARQHGFDLHAAVRIRAGCRDRLERVIRYALRPPIAADRLRLTPEGQVRLALTRRWADGTTHLVCDPTELLERLAAITPRPRINLILYYGVLGPRSARRAQVVPTQQGGDASEALEDARTPSRYLWARLMQRSFGFDVLACVRCGGRMRLVALIDQPPVIQRILRHLGLLTAIPEPRAARDPPLLDPGLPEPRARVHRPFRFRRLTRDQPGRCDGRAPGCAPRRPHDVLDPLTTGP